MQPLPLKQIHPLWLRCCHWINAVTVAGMICSGWRIYNASPLFSFNYPAALTPVSYTHLTLPTIA